MSLILCLYVQGLFSSCQQEAMMLIWISRATALFDKRSLKFAFQPRGKKGNLVEVEVDVVMRDLEVSEELPGFGGDDDRSRQWYHLGRVLGAAKSPGSLWPLLHI